jgi:hypothetical protein
MDTVQTVRHPQDAHPPTFETVWAILQEVGKKQEEYVEQRKRDAAEWEEQRKKDAADFNDRIGGLTNLFGEVTEYMMAPKLREKFLELGLDFPQTSRNTKVNDRVNDISKEW